MIFSHPGNRGTAYLSYLDSAKVCSIGTYKVLVPKLSNVAMSMSAKLVVTAVPALVEVHAGQGKDARQGKFSSHRPTLDTDIVEGHTLTIINHLSWGIPATIARFQCMLIY